MIANEDDSFGSWNCERTNFLLEAAFLKKLAQVKIALEHEVEKILSEAENKNDLDKRLEQLDDIVGPHGLRAHALPVRSVGVKADLRAYEHPVMLSGRADHDTLLMVSRHILKSVPDINRCVWNLGPLPQTLNPRAATTTRGRLALLREVDHLVTEGLRRHGLYSSIWQCPTVLVPLTLDEQGEELEHEHVRKRASSFLSA